MTRVAIFWTGQDFALCDLATDRELELGPWGSMHSAFLGAHAAGLSVCDYWTTRRTAKHRPPKEQVA